MDPMIQGTEHEYTLYSQKMDALGADANDLALEVIRRSDLASASQFLTNGSRAYLDLGHVEIATPECANFWDLLVWEKAGEKIVDLARRELEEEHAVKVDAFKNNTDPDGTSYGSHENYCVSRGLEFPEVFVKKLVPHLITRTIFTGAGDVIDEEYTTSPCAYLTSTLVSGGNLSNTGILHTRDEPHADPERWRRLHIIVGDALLGEVPILLRHFTTSAVLQLIEAGELDDAPQLADPMEAMWHLVETPRPGDWSLTLKSGEETTPVAIQRYYLEKVEPLVGDGNGDADKEKMAFELWEEVLDAYEEGAHDKLRGRVEWLARQQAIDRLIDRKGYDLLVEIAAAKQYSEIGTDRSFHYILAQEGKVERVLEDKDIMAAIKQPPATRAKVRTALCDEYEISSLSWEWVRIKTVDDDSEKVNLDDPYLADVDAVEGL